MTANVDTLDTEFPGTAILETAVLFAGVVMLAATVFAATDPVGQILADWTAPAAHLLPAGN